MNNPTNLEGLSKQEEKLEKARANVIKIIQTRFKQVPDQVIQAINVADFEDFQKRLEQVMSKK